MNILITGAKGFIGHYLVKYLTTNNHKVREVDLEADLTNFDNALRVTKDIDWVYNLAAMNGSIELTTTNHAELVHNNALINLNMAEACWKNGVKRIFFSSSACIYPIGLQGEEVYALKEEDVIPATPDTEYGWEKLFSERLWQSYEQDRGLEVRIGRFFNIYGPESLVDTLKSKAPMALTKKVIDAGNNGNVYIWGDGEQKRSFCYIEDCLKAIDILMNSNNNKPTNIGTEELISINELVDMIADIERVKINKVHQLDKIQGVRTRHSDITRMKSLGWLPTTKLKEGLVEVNKYVKRIS